MTPAPVFLRLVCSGCGAVWALEAPARDRERLEEAWRRQHERCEEGVQP